MTQENLHWKVKIMYMKINATTKIIFIGVIIVIIMILLAIYLKL